ncbi:MAG: hypothetical protein RIQ41_28 [Candidatus Parcubacteria bacterium]|jgi:F0F1-type ATP synthase delta subunit
MTLSRKIAHTVIEQEVGSETLLATLSKYNLESLLPSIVAEMKKLVRMEDGSAALHVESPFPLDERALAHIVSLAEAQGAPIITSHNEELLAGFKARYKGMLYDGSAERIVHALTRN